MQYLKGALRQAIGQGKALRLAIIALPAMQCSSGIAPYVYMTMPDHLLTGAKTSWRQRGGTLCSRRFIKVLHDKRAVQQASQYSSIPKMNRTASTPSRQVPQQGIASSHCSSMDEASVCIKRFLFQLEGIICEKNQQDAENMIASCRSLWSALSAHEVSKLIELAMTHGARNIVQVLVEKCEPGKAAVMPLATQVKLIWGDDTFGTPKQVMDILIKDAICPEHHRECLIDAYGNYIPGQPSVQMAARRKAHFGKQETEIQPCRQAIYGAAVTGSVHDLQKAIDSALGLPPLNDNLCGADWVFNRLHRWVMEVMTIGATKQLVNERIANMPLLHVAVKSGNVEKVRLLIEKGANLASKDKNGYTALWLAKDDENQELIELLEARGAVDGKHTPCTYRLQARSAACRGSVMTGFPALEPTTAARMSWQQTTQLFSQLLPDIAPSFSNPKGLQKNLNAGEWLSPAQAELCTAGYLAEFGCSRVLEGMKSGHGPEPMIEDLAKELDSYHHLLQTQGKALEGEKAGHIHLALDVGVSITAELAVKKLKTDLQDAGLCNVLIGAVLVALDTACRDRPWEYMTRTSRKHAVTVLLAEQLAQMQKALAVPGENGSDLGLHGRLLLRQIAMLNLYCKEVAQVSLPIWREVRNK